TAEIEAAILEADRVAAQQLTAQIIKLRDAQTQYTRSLETEEAANDPVRKATLDTENALRKLSEAHQIAGGSITAYNAAVDAEKLKGEQSLVAAQAKVAALSATTDAQNTLIKVTSEQDQRDLAAEDLLKRNIISRQQYNAVLDDSNLKISKAALATQVLTQQQENLAKAQQGFNEARFSISQGTGSDEEKNRALAEAAVRQDDAARTADTYGNRIAALAGQYDPLITIQKKYLDQLDEIASLSKIATPQQRVELQQAQAIAPLEEQKQVADAL
ncbi:unnamed protein product, partial [Sphagnum balticum]